MPKTRENSGEKKRQYLGRIANRCKVKKVHLVTLGELFAKPGWFNAGYIFPNGYSARIDYRKITDPATQDVYHCEITEQNGKPLFIVRSQTCGRTFEGKSPTACWKQVLDCINLTLVTNGAQPSKTQVAGPEYFGLNDPEIVEQIEALDEHKICDKYWAEKERILVAREEYKVAHAKSPSKEPSSIAEHFAAIQTPEKRVFKTPTLKENENPLPDYTDPITKEIIVNPCISPYGHVLGYNSWVQVLQENENKCPYTKQSLVIENVSRLTKKNMDYFENVILN